MDTVNMRPPAFQRELRRRAAWVRETASALSCPIKAKKPRSTRAEDNLPTAISKDDIGALDWM